jgi:hypothetical protein
VTGDTPLGGPCVFLSLLPPRHTLHSHPQTFPSRASGEINAERVRNRGYLVFATDPSKEVDSAEYQQVYATEARTPNQAIAKVRPLAEGRRVRAFLSTGKYREEVVEARWVG